MCAERSGFGRVWEANGDCLFIEGIIAVFVSRGKAVHPFSTSSWAIDIVKQIVLSAISCRRERQDAYNTALNAIMTCQYEWVGLLSKSSVPRPQV